MSVNNKNKKIIFFILVILLIFIIPVLHISNFKSTKLKVAKAENTAIKQEVKKEVKKELINNNYLQLKDDPNADDALAISKNTNDLIKGSMHYPVRTDRKKVVYLTFDDGPSTTNTPKVLNILKKHDIKATFFVTGKSIIASDESKALLKQIAKEGHAIGNHTYSHNYNYLYPSRTINVNNVISDLKKNDKLMKDILGKDFYTRIIRLPGGYRSWNGKENFKNKMNELGIRNIDWNALNGDAEGKKKNSKELVSYLKNSVKELGKDADSIVVLMHDTYGKAETTKALPEIIKYFKDKGFEFRTIK